MGSLDGLNGACEIDGTRYSYSTTLSLSLDRSVAEVLIQGQDFAEQAVGPYTGEFSGGAVVQSDEYTLLDNLTAGASHTINIYPDYTSTSNYWSFSGYFTSWSAEGPADGFWEIDFSGIIDGEITVNGFS